MKSVECWILAALFAVGLVFLATKLRELQVADSAKYGYDHSRQSVRRVQMGGIRGRILDRHCEPLAENRVIASLACLPGAFQRRTWDETSRAIGEAVAAVGAAIGRPSPLTAQAIRRHVNQSLALPLVAWRDLDERELAIVSERADEFPGFEVRETTVRAYPRGRLAAHLLGYVGRDRGAAEAGDEKFSFYTTEMCGRAGIEGFYDSFLRGVPGERKVLVDARGFAARDWTVVEPRSGPDLVLSLDARIQAAAERELAGLRGGCAVIDPRSGEVLALASAPGFDPNEFVPVLRDDVYLRYAEDPSKPLLNRACAGMYAPGSTFKTITALAGLSAGVDPEMTYECNGVFSLGGWNLRCASRWGHGALDMRHALMKSCNPYFCDLGIQTGTNGLVRAARAFGLGSRTGLDFGADSTGIVPDATWKMRTYRERWYPGDVAQMSIGQGMLLATPLQMARVAGAIGTGFLVTPRLKRDLPVERRPLPFPEKHLAVVRDGMRMVVNGDGEERGPGWQGGADVPVTVCGKTGTAEVGSGATRRKNTWFMAFAPAENPTVAVAMVIENGESGGGTTAPKVGAVLRTVFNAE